MNKCSYILVLFVGVVLSARLTMAVNSIELHTILNKLDNLKDKLQEVEQTVKNSLKETEHLLQEKLIKHENNINEKIETIESKLHAMEDFLKKSVKTNEESTRTSLEEVKSQLISKMNNMQLQLTAETKTIQEKTQTEIKLLGENKKTLDMLTDSVRNISMQGKVNTKLTYSVSSCRQALQAGFDVSGKHMIKIGENTRPFEVFCEQNKFEGGWTVIQHRFDGSVDFYRDWSEYRKGFGNLVGEFWLGLEFVHQITKDRPHELLVEMKDFHGNYGYAKYGEFEIGNESEKYVLKKLGTYSGSAGDSMRIHKDKMFSTFDRDNDISPDNCAEEYHGAWWYSYCHNSNLNGRYQNKTHGSAMTWFRFKDDQRGMSYSRMMIRDIID